MAQRLGTTFEPVRQNPHDLAVENGISGLATDAFRFIVQGRAGSTITARYTGEKFTSIEQTFTLAPSK